jgi:hypothetical protein
MIGGVGDFPEPVGDGARVAGHDMHQVHAAALGGSEVDSPKGGVAGRVGPIDPDDERPLGAGQTGHRLLPLDGGCGTTTLRAPNTATGTR